MRGDPEKLRVERTASNKEIICRSHVTSSSEAAQHARVMKFDRHLVVHVRWARGIAS